LHINYIIATYIYCSRHVFYNGETVNGNRIFFGLNTLPCFGEIGSSNSGYDRNDVSKV